MSPYFDAAYFDPAYFDTGSAPAADTTHGGSPRRVQRPPERRIATEADDLWLLGLLSDAGLVESSR